MASKVQSGGAPTAAEKAAVVDEILAFYESDSQYGVESMVTQVEHACQAAMLAVENGCSEDMIVAGLLHDIGWKLAMSAPVDRDIAKSDYLVSAVSLAHKLGILTVCAVDQGSTIEQQRAQHDVIGAAFLRLRGFRETIPHLIEGHVLAKRYFCLRDPGYHARLSDGSKRTLVFQGGVMTEDEAAIFESDPLFKDCMLLRKFDEAAKVAGKAVPPMASYRDMLLRAIDRAPCMPADIVGSYTRDGNRLVGLNDAVAG